MILGLYGLTHHIVEISGDVTIAGQTGRNKQGKIVLLSQWMLDGRVSQKVEIAYHCTGGYCTVRALLCKVSQVRRTNQQQQLLSKKTIPQVFLLFGKNCATSKFEKVRKVATSPFEQRLY